MNAAATTAGVVTYVPGAEIDGDELRTMRLNPANQDRPKTILHVDEDSSSPFKKARTLSSMPTDESLKETSL